jgi:hypothetical protein
VQDGPHVAVGPGITKSISVGLATRVTWQLGRTFLERLRNRASSVIITPNGDVTALEALHLTGKVNGIPESPTDGRVLARWGSPESYAGGPIQLPLQSWTGCRGTVHCRLFAFPEGVVKIIPPAYEDMKMEV